MRALEELRLEAKGRPKAYHKKYAKQLIAFFNNPPYKEIDVITKYKNEAYKTETKRVPNPPTYLSDYARHIKVPLKKLYAWSNTHKEFAEAITICTQLFEEHVTTNGLLGLYNPTFTVHLTKSRLKWQDKEKEDSPGKKLEHIDAKTLIEAIKSPN